MIDLILKLILWVSIFCNLFIGLLVVLRNPKSIVNLSLGLIVLSSAFWSASLYFFSFPIIFSSRFWLQLTYFSTFLIIGSTYYFSLIFPPRKTKVSKLSIYIYIAVAAFFSFTIFFTRLFIYDVIVESWGVNQIPGILHPVFSLWATSYCIIPIVHLIKSYKKSTGLEKNQLRYIILGIFLFFIFPVTLDGFFPVVLKNSQFLWFSPVGTFFFVVFTSYAITRYRLMDIRLVVARSVSYALLIIFLAFIYAGGLFLVSSYLTYDYTTTSSFLTSTILAIIIAFSFQPLRRTFEKISDDIFYKDHYDDKKLLYELTLIITSTLRLNDLTRKLLHKILREIKITKGSFILAKEKQIFHSHFDGHEHMPRFTRNNVLSLLKRSKIAIFDELAEGSFKKLMRDLNLSIVVPLHRKGETMGVLTLGNKLSGELYTSQDIRLLEIFAPEVTVAIENASIVERLVELDETKSEFISVVSHQLRTPLSAARWNFELLFEQAFGKIPAKAQPMLKYIYSALMDLNQGLNNLMSALEIEEEKAIMRYEKTDITKDIIEETIKWLEQEIQQKKIRLEKKLAFKKQIVVDKHKIRKAFAVLLDNAIRYSPAKTTVVVQTKLEKKDGKNHFHLTIEDHGIGIDAKTRSQLAKKFYRGDKAKSMSPGGFGLGLFIAQSYAKLHHGQLTLDKKKTAGTIVHFTIPVKEEK